MADQVNPFAVSNLPIRLGQFLKLANLVQDGFEAKIHIQHGEVSVNGETVTERGRQLKEGDIVSIFEQSFKIIS